MTIMPLDSSEQVNTLLSATARPVVEDGRLTHHDWGLV